MFSMNYFRVTISLTRSPNMWYKSIQSKPALIRGIWKECGQWPSHISHLLFIQIYDGDGLPDRVCSSCIENLSTAYLFKLQCERINNMLRKSPGNVYNKFMLFHGIYYYILLISLSNAWHVVSFWDKQGLT